MILNKHLPLHLSQSSSEFILNCLARLTPPMTTSEEISLKYYRICCALLHRWYFVAHNNRNDISEACSKSGASYEELRSILKYLRAHYVGGFLTARKLGQVSDDLFAYYLSLKQQRRRRTATKKDHTNGGVDLSFTPLSTSSSRPIKSTASVHETSNAESKRSKNNAVSRWLQAPLSTDNQKASSFNCDHERPYHSLSFSQRPPFRLVHRLHSFPHATSTNKSSAPAASLHNYSTHASPSALYPQLAMSLKGNSPFDIRSGGQQQQQQEALVHPFPIIYPTDYGLKVIHHRYQYQVRPFDKPVMLLSSALRARSQEQLQQQPHYGTRTSQSTSPSRQQLTITPSRSTLESTTLTSNCDNASSSLQPCGAVAAILSDMSPSSTSYHDDEKKGQILGSPLNEDTIVQSLGREDTVDGVSVCTLPLKGNETKRNLSRAKNCKDYGAEGFKRHLPIDDARLPLKKRRCHISHKHDDVLAVSVLLGLKMQG